VELGEAHRGLSQEIPRENDVREGDGGEGGEDPPSFLSFLVICSEPGIDGARGPLTCCALSAVSECHLAVEQMGAYHLHHRAGFQVPSLLWTMVSSGMYFILWA
jgi:hypothetical protein